MASASLGSLLDKENEVSAQIRTPHGKGSLRIPSTSARLPSVSEEPVLKPGQRHLSATTPGMTNRSAFNTVVNTPLKTPIKTPSNQTTNFFFGSFEPAVKPKIIASPAMEAVDFPTRESRPVLKDDEDYPGEFVQPENRISNYLNAMSSCNVFLLFRPCFRPSGSVSESEFLDESSRLVESRTLVQPRPGLFQAVAPAVELTSLPTDDAFAPEVLVEESLPVPAEDRVTERERKMQ